MSKKTLSILWSLAGLTAILLLGLTVSLAIKANQEVEVGITGSVRPDIAAIVSLYAEPRMSSRIISILQPRESIRIINSQDQNGLLWYQAKVRDQTGWVQARFIDIAPAEDIEE